MAVQVYLDTCAILDLIHPEERQSLSRTDIAAFHGAVDGAVVQVVLSLHSIEELLGRFPEDREELQDELECVRAIADDRRFIGDHVALLKSSLRGSTRGAIAHPIFYRGDPIWQMFAGLGTPDSVRDSELLIFVAESRRRDASFSRAMQDIYDDLSERWRQAADADPRSSPPRFEDEWPGVSAVFLRFLAPSAGVEGELSDAQVEAGLQHKTVRMAVGYLSSRTYAGVFLGRTRGSGDWGDMIHAISASTCDVFVTHDPRLLETLCRVPNLGTRTMTIDGLLREIRSG